MAFNALIPYNYVASGGTIASGDTMWTALAKLDGNLVNVSYAAITNTTLKTFVANISATGGTITANELNVALFFLNSLSRIGILGNCTYANLCMGDNVYAAATNLIYQGNNKYVTSVGGTIDNQHYIPLTGWHTGPFGVTGFQTNYNPTGNSKTSFTSVCSFPTNVNNGSTNLVGYSGQGILKTSDAFGFSLVQLDGKSNIPVVYDALFNSKGNHIMVQNATTISWYINGLLYSSMSDSVTGTFSDHNMTINSDCTYVMYFNIGFNSSQALALNQLLNQIDIMLGRNSSSLDVKSIVFEGTSETASYVPPFSTYSPKYPTQVLSALNVIDVNNTLVSQLAISAKQSVTMLSDATGNTRSLNTINFNNKQTNIFIYEGGINDIGNNSVLSADFVYNNYIIPCLQNRIAIGYTNIIETIPSFSGNCTYSGFTAGGLTNYNSASLGARRLNYLIKSDVNNYNGVNAHGVCLTDEIPQFQDSTNLTYFQDGLHFTGPSGAAPIRAALMANIIKKVIGRKTYPIEQYQSQISQLITGSTIPSRAFKNYECAGTFNFILPDPMLFFGCEYTIKNISGIQTIIGTLDGVVNPILRTPNTGLNIKSVQIGTTGFSWTITSSISAQPYLSKTFRTSGTTLTLDNSAKAWYYTGISAATWTLPVISNSIDYEYYIKNTSNNPNANITLTTQSGDNLYYTSVVPTMTIAPGNGFTIQNDGNYWQVL